MNAKEVGEKLVGYARKGQHLKAIEELYSPDIVSIEAIDGEEIPAELRGIDKVRAKNEWWMDNHDVHSMTAEGPYPHRDRFAVKYSFDVTPKGGPMAGKRFEMSEVAVYTVKDGKVVHEEFYYG